MEYVIVLIVIGAFGYFIYHRSQKAKRGTRTPNPRGGSEGHSTDEF